MLQTLRKIDSLIGTTLGDSVKVMFWVFASTALIVCLAYQIQAASFPFQLDYGEAPLVDQAIRLAAGQNIYRATLSTPPYTVSNYPPAYVSILAISAKFLGSAATFVIGRFLSILSIWLASLCVTLIVYTATRDLFAAGSAGAILLAFPYVVTWSPLLRIDSLALALSLAGVAALVAQPTSNRRLITASLLLVAAIYTRQSYALAAPFAGFIWLFSHEKRKALFLALLVGGSSLILFLILNGVTHGGFYFNIVTANVNEFKMDNLKFHWDRLRQIALIFLIFGGISLLLIKRINPLWTLAAPYLFGALISAATIGKIGSNVNYLLELCAALSIAAGVVIATSQKHLPVESLRALIVIALALGVARMVHFTLRDYTGDLLDRRRSVAELGDLFSLIAKTPGDILMDEYTGMLTLQGRPLAIQPFEVTQLAWAGKWDQTALLNSIHNREYAAIIVYDKPWANERWTQEMFDAINKSYRISNIIANNKVYTPYQEKTIEVLQACPGAVWKLPSDGTLGLQMKDGAMDFFGRGNAGKIPVHAVADGLLTRLPDWSDAVAVKHTDPLHPDVNVWSYYSGMAAANGIDSYVSEDFPPGSENIPVKAGQIIGYQGMWSGRPQWAMWTHVHFAMVDVDGQASFPQDVAAANLLDPLRYLGLTLDAANQNIQVLRCNQP